MILSSNFNHNQKLILLFSISASVEMFKVSSKMMMQAGARHRTRFKSKRPTSQAEKLTFSATVDGFFFPLANDQEVELLEATVRANEKTRDQYVGLLKVSNVTNFDKTETFRSNFCATARRNVPGWTLATFSPTCSATKRCSATITSV